MINILAFIASGLGVLNAKRELIKGYKLFNKWVSEEDFQDVHELSRFFFKGSVPYGTVVNLEGIVSDYGHTYNPITYMPTIPIETEFRRMGTRGGNIKATYRAFQPPVEKLPPINYNGMRHRLGFVYPTDFTGYHYEPAFETIEEAVANNKHYLHIPESAKPIPIIYNENINISSGNKYKLKARVVELPINHLHTLAGHLEGFSWNIYSKAFDLTNISNSSLCLLVDEEPLYIKKSDIFSVENLPTSFFVESHIPLDTDNFDVSSVIDDSIPNLTDAKAPIKSFNYTNYTECRAFLTSGNVQILYKEPSVVGFYVPVDIVNEEIYRARVSELGEIIRKFNTKLQNNALSKIGKRLKPEIDFISDMRLVPLLNLQRVLVSDEVNRIVEEESQYKAAKDWLLEE